MAQTGRVHHYVPFDIHFITMNQATKNHIKREICHRTQLPHRHNATKISKPLMSECHKNSVYYNAIKDSDATKEVIGSNLL